ncbi:Solute-binding protein [subsurface metagenome]
MKGLKIRCGPSYFGAVEAIGAVPLSVPFPEIYTSMERGVVDAFLFPPSGWLQFGWAEVTEYVVGPSILHGQNSCPLVNLDVWNSLSEEEKNWVTQPFLDNEQEWYDFWIDVFGGPEYGEEAMKNAGLEFIEWSDEDNAWFQKTIIDATWVYATEQMSPEVVAEFARLIGR